MKPFTDTEVKRANSRVPALMGATEVAAELGVAQQNLRAVANLPEPAIDYLSRGALWRADVIVRFAADRRERLGLTNDKPADRVGST